MTRNTAAAAAAGAAAAAARATMRTWRPMARASASAHSALCPSGDTVKGAVTAAAAVATLAHSCVAVATVLTAAAR